MRGRAARRGRNLPRAAAAAPRPEAAAAASAVAAAAAIDLRGAVRPMRRPRGAQLLLPQPRRTRPPLLQERGEGVCNLPPAARALRLDLCVALPRRLAAGAAAAPDAAAVAAAAVAVAAAAAAVAPALRRKVWDVPRLTVLRGRRLRLPPQGRRRARRAVPAADQRPLHALARLDLPTRVAAGAAAAASGQGVTACKIAAVGRARA